MALAPRRGYWGLAIATSALLALGTWPGRAAGQVPGSDERRALDLFMAAEEAYERGEIQHAVDLLLEARELRREPVLLYNLARAYETLGRIDEALAAYESFLDEEPDVQDRGAIEARIAALRRQIEERERLAAERPSERPAPSPPTGPSAWPWVVVGVGATTVGAAISFGLLSQDARQDAVDDPIHETAVASLARAEDFALTANVLYAVGGAIGLAGAVWAIVDLATSGDGAAPVALRIGPSGLSVAGAF